MGTRHWVGDHRKRRAGYVAWFLACAVLANRTVEAAIYTVTHTGDSGAGSLRQAILDAENNPGPDSIRFQISGTGPFTINLLSPLPALREPLTVDGTTQPGYNGAPLIEVNGAAAGANAHGLYLLTSNCVIRALCINRFSGDGIRIEFGSSNVVEGCYIGLRPDGRTAAPNQQGGITIRSAGNRVGGPEPLQRNVIAGGNQGGVFILDPLAVGNVVQGNYIGVDATGTNALGNLQNGILISAAAGNLIGGTHSGAGNLLSGNGQAGVYLMYPGAAFNRVVGNRIGTDASGTKALANLFGVVILGATSNWIGGLEAGSGNLISGNSSNGVHITFGPGGGGSFNQLAGNWIGTDASGTNALANGGRGIEIFRAPANRIGPSNIVSGNRLSGVLLSGAGATNNVVFGNRIGTDPDGTAALPNQLDGVLINSVSNNLVGGTLPGEGNLISGNLGNGVYLAGATCRANRVLGNFIGTDARGRQPLGNGLSGVRIEGPENQIGDATPGAGNVISGNLENGVFLVERSASNNVIAGNVIGLDSQGQSPLGNQVAGVGLTNAPANLIGGPDPGAGNLISGNADSGIYLNGTLATSNRIQGNQIGTDRSGNRARPNGRDGISGYNAPNNIVGGDLPGARNLISGNNWNGLYLAGPETRGWYIQGNWIGVQADGWSPLGNLYHNIEFLTNSSQHLIGGNSPFAANRIAWARSSGWDGIRIRAGSTNITISGNAIFSNGGASPNGLGIDLGNDGVTPNDTCDPDTGANFQQNFPVLTQAVASASALAIRGWLDSAPNQTYVLWFYAHPTNEPSGYGEGMWPLGQATVTTGANCRGTIAVTLPVTVSPGLQLTATATDPHGNTSEFSQAIPVLAAPRLEVHTDTGTGTFLLRWPATTAGFILQQTTNLNPPVLWEPVSATPTLQNGWYQVPLSNAPAPRFFRLLMP
jgi:titin